jgi:hypothetical protein
MAGTHWLLRSRHLLYINPLSHTQTQPLLELDSVKYLQSQILGDWH